MWVRLVDFLYQNCFKHEINMSFVYVFLEFSALRIKDTISGWYRISGAENTPLFQGKSSTRFFHHVEIPAGNLYRNKGPEKAPKSPAWTVAFKACSQSKGPSN